MLYEVITIVMSDSSKASVLADTTLTATDPAIPISPPENPDIASTLDDKFFVSAFIVRLCADSVPAFT